MNSITKIQKPIIIDGTGTRLFLEEPGVICTQEFVVAARHDAEARDLEPKIMLDVVTDNPEDIAAIETLLKNIDHKTLTHSPHTRFEVQGADNATALLIHLKGNLNDAARGAEQRSIVSNENLSGLIGRTRDIMALSGLKLELSF